MATSLGEGLRGIGGQILAREPMVEYVAIASTVSLILGGVVLPRLIHPTSAGSCPPCPDCPPCACLCASQCVPAGAH
jgi:hypothetical protein